ncbi:hypothetical protein THIOKS13320018 [Thiocapsa sp. KS1]|nr:hypothetical protein [Thiocapsa sp. KS1]CRI66946.1 hypothetical protein THIOKS13320018 [Thiocapsa sp. KS1]
MIDVNLEARRFAVDTIRRLTDSYYSLDALFEVECELFGAAGILSRLGHREAAEIVSRVMADVPPVLPLKFAGDRQMHDLRALLARLEEEIDKQESLST